LRASRFIARGQALTTGLLVLAMALTGYLAWQTQDAVRRHRATAEQVLHGYAEVAVGEYTRRGNNLDYYAFTPALQTLAKGLERDELPAPTPVQVRESPTRMRSVDIARTTFALWLDRDRFESRGEPLSDAARIWLAQNIRTAARAPVDPQWPCCTITGTPDGAFHMVGFQVQRDSSRAPRLAYGIDTRLEAVQWYLQRLETMAPLLPPALTHGNDSLVAVQVRDPQGRELYRSEAGFESPYTAQDTSDVRAGQLVFTAALRPEAAERLIIGGLPRSRLPQLLALLAIAIGLLGAVLVQMRREAELARVRADFVSSVSHELRTPLAQIRMFAETLLLGRVRSSEEERRSLEIVDQEARRLTHLVENILHFSRAERRVLQLVPRRFDLGALVRDVVEGFAPLAAAREVSLRTGIASGLVARADPDAVRQMLLNLLDNAVKYGPRGGTVRVTLQRANGAAHLFVDDEGPGVPPHDRDRIWQRFARLAAARERATTGAGIGLAVVRELVVLHGGRAWVESAPSGGARFGIELPLVEGMLESEATDPQPARSEKR
jgi:signal transduction histidine kinase